MNKKVILFDLDGTVIDSKLGIFNALYYTFDKLKMERGDDSILNKFIGPSIGSSFIKLYGFTQEAAENAVTIYREYYSTKGIYECTPYDGITELTKALKLAGYKVGLATKKPEIFAKPIMDKLDLSKHFDLICGSDPAETHDSKAHIIRHCATTLSNCDDLSDVVMIGDTKYDIIGSNEAGVDSIGVLYGYGSHEEFVQNNCTLIVETVADLGKLFLQ